ncbi:MAG: hypothetical protein RL148_2839 [Planctomycetota bacterium]|jgi:acyl-CoA dehydrogenase
METLLATHGMLSALPGGLGLLLATALVLLLGFHAAGAWAWILGLGVSLWTLGAPLPLWVLWSVMVMLQASVLRLPVSRLVMVRLRAAGAVPQVSETERTAIAAGTVWHDGALFSGRPDLRAIHNSPWPALTPREQAFLDGPVQRACEMTDDWEVHQQRDLPRATWDFLKRERFFGMIVPEEFGGLGFSALANSTVVARLASRSLPLAITVMVPNSLGPAELLVHYGTPAQQRRWLPGLASGAEIPCFALTEPGAGSDAGAIQARGTVFRGADGRLMVRLDWDKRYITLAAVATVLGVAFQLHDPQQLLGRGTDLGITCALVPAATRGVVLGRRHDPMGVPFYNCPTRGEGVVLPLEEAVIGGTEGCGRGWQMLMECLAAGRGISLPATSVGGAQLVARAVGAYAAVRQQFGLAIGRFEGVEEPLARIGGLTYLLEAVRMFTCGGLDGGARPAVVTAVAKYHTTELWRQVVNDGMDVMGGAAISRGPRNLLANPYAGTPIGITVEGANILTRTLMIFGQGAIRCHPYAYREVDAIQRGDVAAFDRAFWPHVGHVVATGVRALVLSVTRGRAAAAPCRGPLARHWRRIAWASASFAFWADVAMATLGGDLKRREKVTGRFADVFSWLYLSSAVLRRHAAEGSRAEDLPLVDWCMAFASARMQQAFDGLFANLPVPGLRWLLRGPVALWSRCNGFGSGPSDRLGARVAGVLLRTGPQRDRLTGVLHVPTDAGSALGRLEGALHAVAAVEPLHRRIRDAVRSGTLPRGRTEGLVDEAEHKGVVTPTEAAQLRACTDLCREAVAVDSFTLDEYLAPASSPQPATA